jgi:sugar lactone lactonase YvrE
MRTLVSYPLRSVAAATVLLPVVVTLLFRPSACLGEPSVIRGYVVEIVAAELDGPVGLEFDRRGDLYVANEGQPGKTYPGTTVSVIDKRGRIAFFANGFVGPSGLAFNSRGDLYVSDDTNTVYRITNGQAHPFVYVQQNPNAIAFDRYDNLYVAPYSGDTVYMVRPDGAVVAFATGFVTPTGLAFDSEGNLYVSNQTVGTISKVAPDGTVLNGSFAIVSGSPEGLAFAPVGQRTPPPPPAAPRGAPYPPRPWWNLFVVTYGEGAVYHIDENGRKSLFAAGFDGPRRVTFSKNGDMYISEFGIDPNFSNRVWRICRHGAR